MVGETSVSIRYWSELAGYEATKKAQEGGRYWSEQERERGREGEERERQGRWMEGKVIYIMLLTSHNTRTWTTPRPA